MRIRDGIKVGFGAVVGIAIGEFVIIAARDIFVCFAADENDESDMKFVNKHCPRTYKDIKELKKKFHH